MPPVNELHRRAGEDGPPVQSVQRVRVLGLAPRERPAPSTLPRGNRC